MTKSPAYPPLEHSLQWLWQFSDLPLPRRLEPSLPFNSALATPLVSERNARHIDPDLYWHAMGFIGSIDVRRSEENSRRIALGAYSTNGSFPQMAFDLRRTWNGHMNGCQVSVMPATPDQAVIRPPEYRIADIPDTLFAADRNGDLTLAAAEMAGVRQVRRLALATGAVLLNAAAIGTHTVP